MEKKNPLSFLDYAKIKKQAEAINQPVTTTVSMFDNERISYKDAYDYMNLFSEELMKYTYEEDSKVLDVTSTVLWTLVEVLRDSGTLSSADLKSLHDKIEKEESELVKDGKEK